jgi:hypothetical protein
MHMPTLLNRIMNILLSPSFIVLLGSFCIIGYFMYFRYLHQIMIAREEECTINVGSQTTKSLDVSQS